MSNKLLELLSRKPKSVSQLNDELIHELVFEPSTKKQSKIYKKLAKLWRKAGRESLALQYEEDAKRVLRE